MSRQVRIILLGMLLWLCCALAAPAWAGKLSEEDVEVLRREVAALQAAMDRGDMDTFYEKTHPAVTALSPSRESFIRDMRYPHDVFTAQGIRIVSIDVGSPTRTYAVGNEEICFVPFVKIAESKVGRGRITSFVVAVRRTGGGDWTFIDGMGLADSGLLRGLFPALPGDLTLPPVASEPIDKTGKPTPDVAEARARAKRLSDEDVYLLRRDIAVLRAALNQGDADTIIAKTYVPSSSDAAERDRLLSAVRQRIDSMNTSGTRLLGVDSLAPSLCYRAGEEDICFVPESFVIQKESRRWKVVSYMAAIRPVAGGEWKYLDGAAYLTHQATIFEKIPALPRDARIPPSSIETLKN